MQGKGAKLKSVERVKYPLVSWDQKTKTNWEDETQFKKEGGKKQIRGENPKSCELILSLRNYRYFPPKDTSILRVAEAENPGLDLAEG